MDAEKLDLSVSVFASVRLKQRDEDTLEAFENMTREQPEIMRCFSMSGDSDYLLRIVVKNVSGYESFMKKVLLHLLEWVRSIPISLCKPSS
jgi:Lrp/AsnC family transcriptional regulator